MKRMISAFILAAITLASVPNATGAQFKTLGPWDVHYMVVGSDFFPAEVLKQYRIVRSKNNLLVNISVLDSQTGKAQDLLVQGKAVDLLGVTKPLNFTTVREGDAIYYLAQIKADDKDRLRFTLSIASPSDKQTLKFEHLVYIDN